MCGPAFEPFFNFVSAADQSLRYYLCMVGTGLTMLFVYGKGLVIASYFCYLAAQLVVTSVWAFLSWKGHDYWISYCRMSYRWASGCNETTLGILPCSKLIWR